MKNEPASPSIAEYIPNLGHRVADGMTLRDYFAAKVLGGCASITGVDFGTVDDVAKTCYRLADAMMEARK